MIDNFRNSGGKHQRESSGPSPNQVWREEAANQERPEAGLTQTDGRMRLLTASRKRWFTRWAFIHALSQMNKDRIRGLWASLSVLTFIWAAGSAPVIYVYGRHKHTHARRKNKWSRLKFYSNGGWEEEGGVRGLKILILWLFDPK